MGWFGNILLLVGVWYIGDKKRWAFLLTAAGEAVYTVHAGRQGMWDLAFICGVFGLLALRSFWKWGDD